MNLYFINIPAGTAQAHGIDDATPIMAEMRRVLIDKATWKKLTKTARRKSLGLVETSPTKEVIDILKAR